jgi:hypothetical protein
VVIGDVPQLKIFGDLPGGITRLKEFSGGNKKMGNFFGRIAPLGGGKPTGF